MDIHNQVELISTACIFIENLNGQIDDLLHLNDSDEQSESESDIYEEYWDTDNDDFCEEFKSQPSDARSHNLPRLLNTTLLFLQLWCLFYNVSATALNHLIQFLHYMLTAIADKSLLLADLASTFPTSLYRVRKCLSLDKDDFDNYVVCKRCNSMYSFEDCIVKTSMGDKTKVCNYTPYRNHPILSRRDPCRQNLLIELILQNKGETKLYPYKTYCYYPLHKSLPRILLRKNYLELCEKWRDRTVPEGMLSDIYDGLVWKEFLNYKGQPFLSQPHNLALMLNCDWFQPFKHTQYSVGVLYLTILNLPRSMRFKPENVLIAGIIPGPSEPKQYGMNCYLRPLVKELNSLWSDGISIETDSGSVLVRAALIATVCDIPATSKLGGFLGHASKRGCWKCSREFSYDKDLNRVKFCSAEVGSPRNHQQHKKDAIAASLATTPTERKKKELQSGSRFTELLHLPYYDCVRFSIIDPMHNLYLGTAKRITEKQWIGSNLLSKTDLESIQEKVDRCVATNQIGQIPNKISSNFARLTANEWKNWTLLFSLIALRDTLPQEHLMCWQLFVNACSIISSAILSDDEITKAQDLMHEFFISAERLYGSEFITFNMHLHLHIHDVLRNYGPCYGYWLFSYERYNGILGKFPTNQRSIEIQLLRHFTDNMHVRSLANNVSNLSSDNLLFQKLLGSKTIGASSETLFEQEIYSSTNLDNLLSLPEITVTQSMQYFDKSFIKFLPPYSLNRFDSDEVSCLRSCYLTFLPHINPLDIPQLCRKYKCIQWWSERLHSYKLHKGDRQSTCIQAFWVGNNGNIDVTCSNLNAGRIEYFFSQNLMIEDEYRTRRNIGEE